MRRLAAKIAALVRRGRAEAAAAAPGYQVSNLTTIELMRDGQLAQDRLFGFLSSLFGVLATTLALVGLYGLISYSVQARTQEIGVRISIGARSGSVLWLFTRESGAIVLAGLAAGAPLALVLARYAEKLLYGVTPADPLACAFTLALMLAGGLAATLVPARRATRINPVEALRYE